MASLYKSSENARRILVVVLFIAVGILAIDTFVRVNQRQLPVAPTEQRFYLDPNLALGEIGRPKIKGLSLTSTPSYLIERVYPSFPDVAYVYQIEKPREKLSSIEDAIENADTLGFDSDAYNITGNIYTWNGANGSKILTYDKDNQKWVMTTDYVNNFEANRRKSLSSDIEVYQRNANTLVSALGFSNAGLGSGKVAVNYAQVGADNTFVQTDRVVDASYVYLDVYRRLPLADLKPDNQLPKVEDESLIPDPVAGYVYTSDPRLGSLRAIVSNNLSNYPRDVYEIKYTNFEYSTFGNGYIRGIYSIIKPQEAWTKIQKGEGVLVSLIPQGTNYFANMQSSPIRRFVADATQIELGYWEPEEWVGYLYPIYIFRGRAELEDGRQASFTFYVDAIKRST